MIFFNLETLTSCHDIQHITLQKNLVFFLTVTNLKCKKHPDSCKFRLLLSVEASVNPGSIQRSADINSTI